MLLAIHSIEHIPTTHYLPLAYYVTPFTLTLFPTHLPSKLSVVLILSICTKNANLIDVSMLLGVLHPPPQLLSHAYHAPPLVLSRSSVFLLCALELPYISGFGKINLLS
jgi:hypothetical protein